MKIGCGEGIRTPDLKVMSLASYQAAPPRDWRGESVEAGILSRFFYLKLFMQLNVYGRLIDFA